MKVSALNTRLVNCVGVPGAGLMGWRQKIVLCQIPILKPQRRK